MTATLTQEELKSTRAFADKLLARRQSREEKPGDNIAAAAPIRPHKQKIDWDVLGPKALAMKAAGTNAAQIGKELGVPPGTMWAWLKKNAGSVAGIDQDVQVVEAVGAEQQILQEPGRMERLMPETDNCPAGRVEPEVEAAGQLLLADDIKQGDIVTETPESMLEYSGSVHEDLGNLAETLSAALDQVQMLMEFTQAPAGKMFGLPAVNWQKHNWTLPGQIKKILEEVGEVSEAIADRKPVEIIRESMDTIQCCKTMISMVLAAEPWIDFDRLLDEHIEKLEEKGYL